MAGKIAALKSSLNLSVRSPASLFVWLGLDPVQALSKPTPTSTRPTPACPSSQRSSISTAFGSSLLSRTTADDRTRRCSIVFPISPRLQRPANPPEEHAFRCVRVYLLCAAPSGARAVSNAIFSLLMHGFQRAFTLAAGVSSARKDVRSLLASGIRGITVCTDWRPFLVAPRTL